MNNVISGNDKSGLVISGANASDNEVFGNRIGTNFNASGAVGNSVGILVTGADNTTIGGTGTNQRNVISGNNRSGVFISGGSTNTLFENNYVGLNTFGTSALANSGAGVFIRAGATQSEVVGNFIAGNSLSQVAIVANSSTDNTIAANHIGIGSDLSRVDGGALAVLVQSSGNTIGGPTAADGNIISGSNVGISFNGFATRNNVVQNNQIGTLDSSPADSSYGLINGVQFLQGANQNTVADNLIAFSSGDAITSPSGGVGNTFSRNDLHSNNFAIDLGPNGSTANDAGDADSGANRLQNSPDITADVSVNQISGSLANVTISYRVDTAPANAAFPLVVEFF